jgi:hypothetical protein
LKWFCFVLGVTTTFIYQPHVRDTKEFQVHLAGRVNTRRDKAEAIVTWLLDLAKWACIEPDTEQIALPFSSWKEVWSLYDDELPVTGLPHVSDTHFKRTRRTEPRLKHIVLRRYLRFAKCNACVDFRSRRNATRDAKLLDVIYKEERGHKVVVREERGSYWGRRDRGRRFPGQCMSVIIDGADQSAFGAPHFREKDHHTQAAHTMAVKIMGAIVHGFASFAYTHLDHVKSGANATIDVLTRVLQAYKDERGKLPPKLYLQLDNTAKQCKNMYLMAFLALLVEHGVFEECIVSFLPVGHTHEDIDQMFSRFAVALRKSDFHSRLGLGKILEGAYHMRSGEGARVQHLSRWTNFSDWLLPHIKQAQFKGISKYRQFMILKNGSGDTVIQARKSCVRGKYRFQGILEDKAVTKPWNNRGSPALSLAGIPSAQRRVLKPAGPPPRGSDGSSDEADAPNLAQQKNSEKVRARGLKVHKVRKGCRALMKVKKTGAADRAALEADLELLCGIGDLPLDLPHGDAALEHLLGEDRRRGYGSLVDSQVELDDEDEGRVMMRSGFALASKIWVAVLMDPDSKDMHKRWSFAQVVQIDKDRAGGDGPIEEQDIVQVAWVTKTRARAGNKYRPGQGRDWIAPDTIQCQVQFTKLNKQQNNFHLKVETAKELQYFLDRADLPDEVGEDGYGDEFEDQMNDDV